MPDPAPPRFTPHLLVPWNAATLAAKRRAGGGGGDDPVDRTADRQSHVTRLLDGLQQAQRDAVEDRRHIEQEHRPDGFAISVEAAEGHGLNLKALDSSGLTLLSARPATPGHPQDAVVWIPDGSVQTFANKISQFTQDTPGGNPKQAATVANIERIQRAVLEHLWQEETPLPDLAATRWWELWFDPAISSDDQLQALRTTAEEQGWQLAPRAVTVGGYHVAQVEAPGDRLSLLLTTNCPAEIRRPSFAEEIHTTQRALQMPLVEDLAARLEQAPPGSPTVCVLDTGIRQSHILLKDALAGRAQSALAGEGPDDRSGHGTEMAGLALYGNGLDAALATNEPVQLTHGIEAVKLLPTKTPGSQRTYGEVTADAVAVAETGSVEQPRARVFSMAVTKPSVRPENGTDGTATLWSATVDALAAGTSVAVRDDRIELLGAPDPTASRLIIVSVGNIRDRLPDEMRATDGSPGHLDLCDTSRIEDPAQAWNILAVGAYTDLTTVPDDPSFAGYRPLAQAGELSPFSRTSVSMPETTPVKPDIVLEGGNLLVDETNTQWHQHDIVGLTTTGIHIDRPLTTANATSAATAQAAHLAAMAHAAYPALRPEAVRALLVHEARWTAPMLQGVYTKSGRPRMGPGDFARKVLRRYGWGVPTQERVLSSAANAVTLMIQDTLTPYHRHPDGPRLGELKLHTLPWPREQLDELGGTDVELRVTLSYFIEPNPGRKGVRGQHTYPSHRLRFAMKSSLESQAAFERRIAQNAEAEDDGITKIKNFEADDAWVVGPTNRNRGSLHSDVWRGDATTLAGSGMLAVYPAGGWWKDHNRTDRIGRKVSYALLISLATPEVTTDLYTPTALKLDVPIPTGLAARPQTSVGASVQLPIDW
ncbi:S8 family peptidase [Streptomyces sp. NRRL B-24484]|uniref:S8 family peptidase n=1 Tax=Streptomyces sp. NRRL B-24484 TaxID=1463833 RepID=UPI000694F57C|nr:S8 family peptidase [Streptomyces sp. NRRL B-24484]